jgi:hypothetical protein
MSEHSLYGLSQRLRLLARAGVHLGRDGRVLGGSVDQQVEAIRQSVLEALWAIQDGITLSAAQVAAVATGRELERLNAELLRHLKQRDDLEYEVAC